MKLFIQFESITELELLTLEVEHQFITDSQLYR